MRPWWRTGFRQVGIGWRRDKKSKRWVFIRIYEYVGPLR